MKKWKKGQFALESGATSTIITLVVVVIIGIVALQVVDTQVDKSTNPQDVVDESITASNSTYVAFDHNDWVSNSSCNITGATAYTADLTNGAILVNDTYNGAVVTCNYSYYDGAYSSQPTTRTVVGLTPAVWAVVLISIVAAFAIGSKFM